MARNVATLRPFEGGHRLKFRPWNCQCTRPKKESPKGFMSCTSHLVERNLLHQQAAWREAMQRECSTAAQPHSEALGKLESAICVDFN